MQLAQVRHAALGQIDMGLYGNTRGHGGPFHQIGVRGLLAADHHGRDSARDHGVDGVLQSPVATEDPNHHHGGALK